MAKTKGAPVHGKQVKGRLDPVQLTLVAGLAAAVASMAAVSVTAHRHGIGPGDLADPILVVEPFLPVLLAGIGALILAAVVVSRATKDLRRKVSWRLAPLGGVLLGLGVAGLPSGTVYAPFELVRWSQWFTENGLLDMRQEALVVFGGVWAFLAVGLIAAAKPGHRKTSGAHGSAEWGTGEELKRPDGFILGRDQVEGGLLRWKTDGHLLTVARTRSGKGVGSIIPNLLDYEGPVVVTDPKGENFEVCSDHRKSFDQDVVALDPFGLVVEEASVATKGASTRRATLNVLADVPNRTGPAVEAADLTADMLVISDGAGANASFWENEAQAWLSALTLYTIAEYHNGFLVPGNYGLIEAVEEGGIIDVATGEFITVGYSVDRHNTEMEPIVGGHARGDGAFTAPTTTNAGSLVRVWDLISLSPEGTSNLIAAMKARPDYGGRIAAAAWRFEQKAEKERSGVVSTAQGQIKFLNSPEIAEVLSNTEAKVNLQGLIKGDLSIFIILPAAKLDTLSRWQRLVVAYALKTITDSPIRPAKRVLFVLDEFANLQRMNPVMQAVSLLAGFGASLWIFLQDLSQLESLYGKGHETFIANADVFQVFGTADVKTAEYASKRAGDTTVWAETESTTRGSSKKGGGTRNRSRNTSEKGRRLITPDEVLTDRGNRQLLFIAGERPVMAGKIRYYQDPEFKGKYAAPVKTRAAE